MIVQRSTVRTASMLHRLTIRWGLRLLSCAAALVMLAGTPAHAGLLSWSHSTYAINGSENGTGAVLGATGDWTYATAWNAAGASDVTVNGVDFLANPTSTDVTLTISSPTATVSGQNTGKFTGTFQTLMSSLIANSGDSASWSITLNNLDPGSSYRVQFLSYQAITFTSGTRDMEIHFGPTVAGAGTGFFDAGSNVLTVGHSWTAQFIADATTQTFLVAAGSNDRSIINAVSVFTIVPTPATLPMGLVLLGLMMFKRPAWMSAGRSRK